MDIDLAARMTSLSTAKTQHSAQIAVLKKQTEMDRSLVAMLDEAVRSVPAPNGPGQQVDRTA